MSRTITLLAGLLVSLAACTFAQAESTATLEKTHLCCDKCVKAVAKVLATVPGAKGKCDKKTGTITITATDDATAQKAVDALVAAGFYGTATGATIKADASAPTGMVKSLKVTGIHNCCKSCATAINKVIKSVDGAKGEVKPAVESFTVTGDFDAATLIKALNDAGFSCKAE